MLLIIAEKSVYQISAAHLEVEHQDVNRLAAQDTLDEATWCLRERHVLATSSVADGLAKVSIKVAMPTYGE
jgi:hypothetical protein